jgi:hypothetical protein
MSPSEDGNSYSQAKGGLGGSAPRPHHPTPVTIFGTVSILQHGQRTFSQFNEKYETSTATTGLWPCPPPDGHPKPVHKETMELPLERAPSSQSHPNIQQDAG